MDKDRDISRSVTPITPRKVGFVGSAVLAGSALLAACGGGSKSTTTPEGGVGGAQSNPTTGSTIEIKTAIASPTTKVEVPTATPTQETELTQEQITEIAGNVEQMILSALTESPISDADMDKIHMAPDYKEPTFISASIGVCVNTKIGDPYSLPGTLKAPGGPRIVKPGDVDYGYSLVGTCFDVVVATKTDFDITGNTRLRDANIQWQLIARRVFEAVANSKIDPQINEGLWKNMSPYFLSSLGSSR